MRAIEVDIHPWLKFRLLETQQEREVFTSFGAKKSWKKASEYLSFVSPFLGFFLAWNVCVHPLINDTPGTSVPGQFGRHISHANTIQPCRT